MKLHSKSEWLLLDKPLAEPNAIYREDDYLIERRIDIYGAIVWYGLSINWKKELNKSWTVLSTNENAKPLTKYLPDIVYGDDRIYWKECETPIYEKLYNEMFDKRKDKLKNIIKI